MVQLSLKIMQIDYMTLRAHSEIVCGPQHKTFARHYHNKISGWELPTQCHIYFSIITNHSNVSQITRI